MDVAEPGGAGVVGGEGEPAGAQAGLEQGLETRLVERHDAAAEGVHPPRVGVDAKHLEAEAGQARRLGGAQVAGPDDGQPE
jgi:hypothetical protein